MLRTRLGSAGSDSLQISAEPQAKRTFTVVIGVMGQWRNQYPNNPGTVESMIENGEAILELYSYIPEKDRPHIKVIDLEDAENANNTAMTIWPPYGFRDFDLKS